MAKCIGLFKTDSDGASVPDRTLMDLVKDLSPADLDNIATQHLGIKPHEIRDISVAVRENIQMRKFQILELWRNRYTGPDALSELQKILRDQQIPYSLSTDNQGMRKQNLSIEYHKILHTFIFLNAHC